MSANFAAKLAKLVKSSKVANPTPVYEPISVPMINQGLNLEPQVLALQVATKLGHRTRWRVHLCHYG